MDQVRKQVNENTNGSLTIGWCLVSFSVRLCSGQGYSDNLEMIFRTYLRFSSLGRVLGASGDLAKKKTFPALFANYRNGYLPTETRIVGYARTEMNEEEFHSRVKQYIKNADQQDLKGFLSMCTYIHGAYDKDESWQSLNTYINKLEKEANTSHPNRLFYMALPPSVFIPVAQGLKKNVYKDGAINRVVIEKPFGMDLDSSRELGKAIGALFTEDEIYRIDHYLGKEMVKNIMSLRFANVFFGALWDKTYIENVQITFKEPFGTEGRGGYFDEFGIVRDVMQNHLLQVVSLIAMERPKSLSAEAIRDEKVKVLGCIPPIAQKDTLLGQYTASPDGSKPGYLDDDSLKNKQSKTPTFATLVAWINNERWEGVPFIMRAGKALNEQKVEIRIQFRNVAPGLFSDLPRNELVIRVQPNEAVYMKFNNKTPGLSFNTMLTELDLTYGRRYSDLKIPDAYEALILDVLRADHSNFVRDDELDAAWKIFTPLLHWIDKGEGVDIKNYAYGSRGPSELDDFVKRYGFRRHDTDFSNSCMASCNSSMHPRTRSMAFSNVRACLTMSASYKLVGKLDKIDSLFFSLHSIVSYLGKASRDLLGKDFPTGAVLLEVKTTAPNGVSFKVNGAKDAKTGIIAGNLETKYSDKKNGLTFTESWTTSNHLSGKVELENNLAKGLKVELNTSLLPSVGEKSARLGVTYKQPNVHTQAVLDVFKTHLAINSVVGHEGILAGAEVSYDILNNKVTRYNTALGYTASDYAVALHATNNLSVYSASYYHRVSAEVEAAGKAVWDSKGTNAVALEVGAKYKLDSNASLKAKISNSGVLGLGYTQLLRPGVKMTLGGSIDTTRLNENAHRGLDGYVALEERSKKATYGQRWPDDRRNMIHGPGKESRPKLIQHALVLSLGPVLLCDPGGRPELIPPSTTHDPNESQSHPTHHGIARHGVYRCASSSVIQDRDEGPSILCDSPVIPSDLPQYQPRDTPVNMAEEGEKRTDSNGQDGVHKSTEVVKQNVTGHEEGLPALEVASRETEQPEENDAKKDVQGDVALTYQAHQQTRVKPRKVLGNYTLTKTLGAGSMGKVKLAVHSITGEKLAVKIIPRSLLSSSNENISTEQEENGANRTKLENKELRTIREASIMLLLHHPYIVQTKEVMVLPHHYYMFFEYVGGGQLLDYIISHGRLKERQARKFARQITSALDYCHRNSIVHRDLKIENILISKAGDIKIIDFGLSNLYSPHSHLSTFCGSLYFAAPELLNAKLYTGPEVDVWSLGIVLYVLVCGKVPFDDQSMPALHAKIKKGVVDYPSYLTSDCKSILSRMLVTNPAHRATISEIILHPWMNKGYDSLVQSFVPHRPPLTLPIDMEVVRGMTGFEFPSEEEIKEQLEQIVTSPEYQKAAKVIAKRNAESHLSRVPSGGGLHGGLLQRKGSFSLADDDPQTIPAAYHPLVSIYYLVREKMARDNEDFSRASSQVMERYSPESSSELLSPIVPMPPMPTISKPETAHAPDIKITERPFHREQGLLLGRQGRRSILVDEGDRIVVEEYESSDRSRRNSHKGQHEDRNGSERPGPGSVLRKLSTALGRANDDKADKTAPESDHAQRKPHVRTHSVSSTLPQMATTFQERANAFINSHQPAHSPSKPHAERRGSMTSASSPNTSLNGRSKSEFASRFNTILSRTHNAHDTDTVASHRSSYTPGVGGKSVLGGKFGSNKHPASELPNTLDEHAGEHEDEKEIDLPAYFDMSLEAKDTISRVGNGNHIRTTSLGAEDHEEDYAQPSLPVSSTSGTADEAIKPVFLKGLFSVTTTSTKHPSVIRSDLIRVLERSGVKWREIKGGFECVHIPSIDVGNAESTVPMPDLVVRFEIYIVKVPWLLGMHGLQFRRVGGGVWQYKNMCSRILAELKL
ncbi:hypothetical protein BZG36_03105 [Bifiguratus adelaidae]|uniref:Glucose-6-phosphate 1-dehydrogenase n=1 Tax=Bifiguratus adelaidae TaxID=1938954 RepID=A0A261XZ17_9FUNG|nr:hypothetical protein BZG36_03105 [Bifiguratus adelaidae]